MQININMHKAEIGIIGGAGYYSPNFMDHPELINVNTPYGHPSYKIYIDKIFDKSVAFLPRHGKTYEIVSPFVNFRANIFALKKLGVKKILAPCAAGSLNKNICPGDFVIPNQLIDTTKNRIDTFSTQKKFYQVNSSKPFDTNLTKKLTNTFSKLRIKNQSGTYICIEGPRFATEAEKRFYQSIHADIIGMDLYPENVLAMEQKIAYTSFALVTDYAMNDTNKRLLKSIFDITHKNAETIEKIITHSIKDF
jgi:5'-methylthioadenosine phosphorylase